MSLLFAHMSKYEYVLLRFYWLWLSSFSCIAFVCAIGLIGQSFNSRDISRLTSGNSNLQSVLVRNMSNGWLMRTLYAVEFSDDITVKACPVRSHRVESHYFLQLSLRVLSHSLSSTFLSHCVTLQSHHFAVVAFDLISHTLYTRCTWLLMASHNNTIETNRCRVLL